jgi:hypothetical protein
VDKPTDGVIYGVRLRVEFDYRYIGLTTKSEHVRLRQHFKVAAAGRKTPFYDWLRVQETRTIGRQPAPKPELSANRQIEPSDCIELI